MLNCKKKLNIQQILYVKVGNTLEINNIAGIGDEISFKSGIKGVVEKIYDNSVIVSVTENNTDLEFEGNKTVVGHKNYDVI
ncbi:hypothetical protein CIL05_10790 [Virgibacillus profundi]|uniref:DUF2187 domain-containing protein n=1 Tax=Virgibacillus profundi TaxID=2024555 RepID=A0A2A2IE45_9BACI|nr:hypothetical protein CIL05_10790 [Virgibacillus profundi]PXY53521.1 DUF2187 domain-containing protein [Virgibacillus profundi]